VPGLRPVVPRYVGDVAVQGDGVRRAAVQQLVAHVEVLGLVLQACARPVHLLDVLRLCVDGAGEGLCLALQAIVFGRHLGLRQVVGLL